MRKFIFCLIIFSLVISFLTACNNKTQNDIKQSKVEISMLNYSLGELSVEGQLLSYDMVINNYTDKAITIKSVEPVISTLSNVPVNIIEQVIEPKKYLKVKGTIKVSADRDDYVIKEVKLVQEEPFYFKHF